MGTVDVECEAETSRMILEDESSSIVFVEDKRSSKCPWVFSVSGKARWCLNNFVLLPSVWSEKVKLGWERDYNERNRVIEIFQLNIGYKGLVGKLNNERIIMNNRDLPCVTANNDYIEADNNIHLPVVSSVLVANDGYNDENVNHLIVTNDTDGDLTIPYVDKAYDKIIMGDNPGNYYTGIMEKTNLCGYYIKNSNVINLNKSELCIFNIRLIFDDGG